MDNVGLKIITKNEIAKCIKIVREYTNLSIGEIKEKIEKNDYVLEGSYVKEEDILLILKVNKQLLDNEIKTELYEHNRKTSEELLKNLVNSYMNINEEISKRIDLEL